MKTQEFRLVVHRNGRREYCTRRKYILMKILFAGFIFSTLMLAFTILSLAALLTVSMRALFLIEFCAILLTGCLIIAADAFLR